jgi:hypothetical protein
MICGKRENLQISPGFERSLLKRLRNDGLTDYFNRILLGTVGTAHITPPLPNKYAGPGFIGSGMLFF